MCFISMYNIYIYEAHVRPEKYWLVCAGLLANHLFDLNFIFLSDSLTVAGEREAGIADIDSASRLHSAAMERSRGARMAARNSLAFRLQYSASSELTNGEYMLSQKLLVDVDVDMFAVKNRSLAA
jgi:hypothetical protein